MNTVERISERAIDAMISAVIGLISGAIALIGVVAVIAPVVILGIGLPGLLLSAALLVGYLLGVAEQGLKINPNHRFESFIEVPVMGGLGVLFMAAFVAIVGIPAAAMGWSTLGIAISVALGLFLLGLAVRPIAEAVEDAVVLFVICLPVLLLAAGLVALWVTLL